MRIDLHTHTNCSDGTFSPIELVEHAKLVDVSVLAITDHDTVQGCQAALEHGKKIDVKVISGVELSIDYPLNGNGHVHLVGLFIDPKNPELVQALNQLQQGRLHRAEEILKKLAKIDMPVAFDELKKVVGTGSPGRPHIVSLMLQKGYIRTAFQGYTQILGKGCPAYVSKKKLKMDTAIDLIHNAGGLAILAHPISLMFANYPRLGDEILKFQEMGLDGIEVYYSSHDHYFTKWLFDFCRKHYLLISGGSDFHGKAKPDVELGRGRRNIRIPYTVYQELERAYLKAVSN